MPQLMTVVLRRPVPEPWAEGEKIPWNDPEFSRRMLREHLSQEHDAASRRFDLVDKQVDWIQQQLLADQPARVLDLGCGPGLYASRLAQLGYECMGIDFSPASIQYAREWAAEEGLACHYHLEDIRTADYGQGYSLAMLIFGEFNVFSPADARSILNKAYASLVPGGRLLLEVHALDLVRTIGKTPSAWYSAAQGLFADGPHLCLQENFWDEARQVATERYFIVDAATGAVTRYASSMQGYSDEQYRLLLSECGFAGVEFYPAMGGVEQPGLIVLVARRPAGG